MIGHLLNRELAVWRQTTTTDEGGGQSTAWAQTGTVRARVSQPSAAERQAAQQAGSELTHAVYVLAGEDVRRGDELRGDGQVLDVVSTFSPSEPAYLRADCTQTQAEG
jgi:SPP1 family predicted phage head-tail adaptor